LEILEKIDPSKIERGDCFWLDYYLQIILAQLEVINSMSNEDICKYITQLIRCHDTLQVLTDYPSTVTVIVLGLGNIMIRYEYKPFVQILSKDPNTNKYIYDTMRVTEEFALQVIDNINQFKKGKK